jgi:hypothetical protein
VVLVIKEMDFLFVVSRINSSHIKISFPTPPPCSVEFATPLSIKVFSRLHFNEGVVATEPSELMSLLVNKLHLGICNLVMYDLTEKFINLV